MIDLHSHTTASDGENGPLELVHRAREAGVTTLAVTDHDTVVGIAEAEAAGRRLSVRIVPGIELSAFVGAREVHVLGHFIDPRNVRLVEVSALLRVKRRERIVVMVERLAGLGVAVSVERVEALSGGENLGRPHLARALVEAGCAADVADAFRRYLGPGRPAFVERYKLAIEEAIGLVRAAGGTATLAHPGVSKLGEVEVREMRAAGLAGLEVDHSDHRPEQREAWRAVATALDLVPTAGSDYHGETVAPGRRLGTAAMDERDFRRLEARRGIA